tara:strand:+ start:77 stop:901 length:825 start_codon:yes stop_codon:yes gene_type:complete
MFKWYTVTNLKILCNFGTGDTVNQILWMESVSNRPYDIIASGRNVGIIHCVFAFLQKNKPTMFSGHLTSFDVPLHGFPPNLEVIGINPRQDINNLPNESVIHVHTGPRDWHPFISCSLNLDTTLPQAALPFSKKTCILFAERSDNVGVDNELWLQIIIKLQEKGYEIFSNISGKDTVYNNEKTFPNTLPLSLSHIDLCNKIKASDPNNVICIGQRSGMFDLLKWAHIKKIVLYPNNPVNFYEMCNFQTDPSSKNTHDIPIVHVIDTVEKVEQLL